MIKRLSLLLMIIAGIFVLDPVALRAAATLDKAVCSTADKASGNPAVCDGNELVDSANQEISKLYQGNLLVVTIDVPGSSANVIKGSTTPVDTTLDDGDMRQIKPPVTNTSTVTYNDNSLGAKQVVSLAGASLSSGDLQSSSVYILRYYAANDEWRVLTPLGTGGSAPSTPSYVTLATNASLASERVLTAGTCVSLTDAGANSTATVAVASCSSSNLAGALSDEVGTGALMFGIAAAMSDDITCTGGHFLRRNAGDTAWECAAISGGGDALTSNPLSQFAATTSSQFAGVLSDETGSGAAVFATSPTLTTPTLGVATATSVNKVTITAPATSATLTIPDGVTLTGPAASGTAMTLGNTETVTGVKTFGSAGAVGRMKIAGTISGSTTLDASATASGTLTLPAATDTLVGKATTDTLTNKSVDLASNTLTSTSAQMRTALSDEVGTGALMFGIAAAMSDDITCTGGHFLRRNAGDTAWECAAISGGGDALTSNPLSQFAATTSSQFAGVLSDETGSGAAVFATSPTLVTPALGTPSSGTMTNVTGLPISTGVAGLGTGIATALAVNVGTAGAPVVNGGALGTPSSGTLTNATGLPISSGVSGLGTGVATALATFSSANLRSAATDEVGTGSLMFGLVSTMTDDLACTGSQVVRRNAGDTAFECATVSGTGDMVAANNLSDVASAATAFGNIKQAATTSATGVVELATVAEATTGTDTTRAITADGLAAAVKAKIESFCVAASDETTAITTGTAKTTFRMPYAFTLTNIRGSLNTVSSSGSPIIDVNEAGTTLMTTNKVLIDVSEKTSVTAVTAPTLTDTSLADDAEITIDVDTAGTGAKGLKICLIGYQT